MCGELFGALPLLKLLRILMTRLTESWNARKAGTMKTLNDRKAWMTGKPEQPRKADTTAGNDHCAKTFTEQVFLRQKEMRAEFAEWRKKQFRIRLFVRISFKIAISQICGLIKNDGTYVVGGYIFQSSKKVEQIWILNSRRYQKCIFGKWCNCSFLRLGFRFK